MPGLSSPTPIMLILAMLCSNPQIMKIRIHQTIMISLPDSLFILVAHQTARQTQILHRMPLNSILSGDNATFAAAVEAKNAAIASLFSTPEN